VTAAAGRPDGDRDGRTMNLGPDPQQAHEWHSAFLAWMLNALHGADQQKAQRARSAHHHHRGRSPRRSPPSTPGTSIFRSSSVRPRDRRSAVPVGADRRETVEFRVPPARSRLVVASRSWHRSGPTESGAGPVATVDSREVRRGARAHWIVWAGTSRIGRTPCMAPRPGSDIPPSGADPDGRARCAPSREFALRSPVLACEALAISRGSDPSQYHRNGGDEAGQVQ
jgi:hypothetical protein